MSERPIDAHTELRLLTDHAPVMLFHCDNRQRFVFVNRAYSQRFGLSPEAVEGCRIVDVLGSAAYARIQPHIEAVLRGESLEFETEVPYEQIGLRVMHCVYRPHLDAVGQVLGWVGTLEDVTARVRAETALVAREKQHRLLLEGVPQLVWTCLPDGWCDYLSPQWTAYTG